MKEDMVTTHEVGHWLGLPHTFEGCDVGDGIEDTFPQERPTGRCSNRGKGVNSQPTVEACGALQYSNELNFMDYS